MFKTRAILYGILFVIVAIAVTASAGYAQAAKSRRDAVGPAIATLTETLLHNLFPGATLQWDPVLTIRVGNGPSEPVDLGDFTAHRLDDGSTGGVAMLEVGSAKATHIQKLKKFQSADGAHFDTTLVAFRIPSSGSGMEIKKMPLDPYDPLTKINWFEVDKWLPGGGPILHVRYESYSKAGDSVMILEWDSLVDMATGSFSGRIPAGITVLRKDGRDTQGIFSVHRTSPTQIEILDSTTGKTISYACGNPCVVDSRTFMGQLSERP
jgi:hypothetical protein